MFTLTRNLGDDVSERECIQVILSQSDVIVVKSSESTRSQYPCLSPAPSQHLPQSPRPLYEGGGATDH